jgi:hypothetical protein
MANQNPTLNIKNLNYIQRATPGTLKPHLVAEAFQDVQSAYGQQGAAIATLQTQLAAALERIAKLEQG